MDLSLGFSQFRALALMGQGKIRIWGFKRGICDESIPWHSFKSLKWNENIICFEGRAQAIGVKQR
ncbi:hypothetical protein HCZ23_12450 [Celeribacter sp. HF31]|uniref:hypothetical protein n=1 Tax=Celeribacter sp. HF31 TaxID=2721558 RepID=UPI0014304393|nr:hypothetical protein [Celeribacter sp. HF31]NIY80274.1 hypothetical protein [Celeribacter sp. HF31]